MWFDGRATAKRQEGVIFSPGSVRRHVDARANQSSALAPLGNRDALVGRKKPDMQQSYFNLLFANGACTCSEIEHAQSTFLVASITPSLMDATYSGHYLTLEQTLTKSFCTYYS